MKDKVIQKLIKSGYNETTVKAMVGQQYAYVVKTYPEAKVAKVADIVSTLWSMS